MRILVTGGRTTGRHFVYQALAGGHTPVAHDNLQTGHRWAVAGGVKLYEAGL